MQLVLHEWRMGIATRMKYKKFPAGNCCILIFQVSGKHKSGAFGIHYLATTTKTLLAFRVHNCYASLSWMAPRVLESWIPTWRLHCALQVLASSPAFWMRLVAGDRDWARLSISYPVLQLSRASCMYVHTWGRVLPLEGVFWHMFPNLYVVIDSGTWLQPTTIACFQHVYACTDWDCNFATIGITSPEIRYRIYTSTQNAHKGP